MKRILLLLICLLLVPGLVNAQYVPWVAGPSNPWEMTGCSFYYRADTVSGDDGTQLDTITDLTANNNDLAYSGNYEKVRIKTNILNGKRAFWSTGGGHNYVKANGVNVNYNDFTMVAVIKSNAAGAVRSIFNAGQGSYAGRGMFIAANNTVQLWQGYDDSKFIKGASTATLANGSAYLIIIVSDKTNLTIKYYINNGAPDVLYPLSGVWNVSNISLGCDLYITAPDYHCDIGYFDHALSADEITTLKTMINNFYSIW